MQQLERWIRLAALAPVVVLGVMTIVASGGAVGPLAEPPDITTVTKPRVTMLGAGVAVVTHYQSLTRGVVDERRELVRSRYTLSTGTSELISRTDIRSVDAEYALGNSDAGVALNVVGTAAVAGGIAERTEACAIGLTGAAACLTVNGAHSPIVTASGAVSIFGGNNLQQQAYFAGIGWGAAEPGPELPADSRMDAAHGLKRWRDGSMFLVAATTDGRGVATRFDRPTGRWQAAQIIAPPGSVLEARLALHPDAPAAAPVAVWQSGGAGIQFSVWDGAAWSVPALVPGSAGGQAPSAAMWPNGDVLIAWTSDTSVLLASRRVGGAWVDRVALGPAVGKISLGVDRAGNAVALSRVGKDLQATSYVAGEGWQPAITIGSVNDADSYDLAMHDDGRALAVWARGVDDDPFNGSRLAIAEVGPFALTLTAQRYTFGGDTLPLTISLANAPTQATTVSLSTSLPAGSISLPPSLPVAANQSEVTFNVPTSAVAGFVDGAVVLTYGAARVNRPVTLMPAPTGAVLTVNPPSVLGGAPATINVQVAPVYPIALDLQMASNSAVATVPAQVTTGMTSSAAAVPVTTMATATAQTVTFSAGFRGLVLGTGSLLVNPTALGQSVLTLTLQGSGTVTSTPAGINCGPTCTASYPTGTPVTLLPAPLPGNRFFAWDGDPDCSDGVLTMTTARACTAIFQPQLPPYSDGVSWTYLGNLLFGLSTVNPSPALALDGVHPVVAYVAQMGAASVPQLFVNRFEFGTYSDFGGGSLNVNTLQAASEPSLVTTSKGLPYVAWIEGTGAQQNLYVKRWLGGNQWLSVGPPGTALNFVAGSLASSPSIALDAELRPMVAWIENGAVKFKRFDGIAWVQAQGGEGPASANADRVRMSSFAGLAEPVIAWTQGSGMARALKVVRELAFTPLGTQVNAASLDPLTEFAVLAENGGGIVTWGDGGQPFTPFTIRSQRWDGANWVGVASNDVASSSNRLLSIAMPRNALAVAHAATSDNASIGAAIYFSSKSPGINWPAFGLGFPFVGDPLVGLTGVEMAGASPIVVVVRRNALNQYVWQVLRYYP